MGTPSHTQDLALIEEVLFKLRDKYDPSVQFVFWGCTGNRLGKLGQTIPFDDCYASFLRNLGTVHFDIGLAPWPIPISTAARTTSSGWNTLPMPGQEFTLIWNPTEGVLNTEKQACWQETTQRNGWMHWNI